MTEQACVLGIPSIQLEIPKALRILLFKDADFSRKFLQVIVKAYQEIISVWWPVRSIELKPNEEIAQKLKTVSFTKEEL